MTTNAVSRSGGTILSAAQLFLFSPAWEQQFASNIVLGDKNRCANYLSVKLKDKSEATQHSLSQFGSKCPSRTSVLVIIKNALLLLFIKILLK